MKTAGGRLRHLLRRDPWLATLIAVAAVQYAVLAPHLVYPDLGLHYPFQGGDSLDWLLNALALAGEDVRNSLRPPALPLALALLRRLGVLSWFPLLNLALHHAAAVGAHLVLRRRHGRPAAFTCGLLVLLNASLLLLALQVMADLPAAILLGAACAAFLAAGRRPGWYLAAGVLGGLSALTQQAALLLPLPAAITVLLARRHDLRRRWVWAGAALFAAFPAGWYVAKTVFAGDVVPAGVSHWSLLGVQPENVPHYLVAALSFWGWPTLLLVAAGAVASIRGLAARGAEAEDRAWSLLPLLATLVLLVFFALFYDFLAKRFLVYAFFPSLALAARGLAGLRGTRAFGAAAALAVAIAAWPLPNPELANRATLWPVPTVYSVIPTGHSFGDPLPRLSEAHVQVAPWRATIRRSAWSRVLEESRTREPAAPIDLVLPEEVEAVVYLGDAAPGGFSLYETLTRLGYLLRRTVTHVPEELYPEKWWAWQDLEPMGVVDRYRLFRLRLPGVTAGAIIAFSSRNPRGRAVGRQARWGRELTPRPGPERLEADVALARRVAAVHEGGGGAQGPIVVLPEARGSWERLLPFFVTGVLGHPGPEEAGRIVELAERRPLESTRVGGLRVVRFDTGRMVATLVAAGG